MDKPSSSKKVTLVDVAAHAGVSRATASLVLRNSPLVAEKTRIQVQKSMQELGYVYNRAAANLRSNRTQTIGLLVTDITNPFFAELAVHVESQMASAKYTVMLSNTLDSLERQNQLLNVMFEHQVDGLLLCPAEGTTPDSLEMLDRWELPHVLVARYIAGVEADYAGPDNTFGAVQAVSHLLEQGHKRIAFIGGSENASARQDRLVGYQLALSERNISFNSELLVSSTVTRKGGFEAIQHLLSLPEPPTAALCYNDVVAFGVMLGLQSQGISPGREFGIVGFDDIADASLVRPSLTTVAIKPAVVGQTALDLLLERIESPAAGQRRKILTPQIVVRESTTA